MENNANPWDQIEARAKHSSDGEGVSSGYMTRSIFSSAFSILQTTEKGLGSRWLRDTVSFAHSVQAVINVKEQEHRQNIKS
jgi:hypothetical protein